MVVAALVAVAGVLATRQGLFTPSHPVPSLVGKTTAQADAILAKDKFHLRVTGHTSSITLGAGRIVSQRPSPRAGTTAVSAKQGSTIDAVVSTGPPPVAIPSLTSATSCTAAVQQLAAVHLVGVCPPSAAQYSSTVVAGAVVGHHPDRHRPLRLDGDHRHLQGPRPGGRSLTTEHLDLCLGLGCPHRPRVSGRRPAERLQRHRGRRHGHRHHPGHRRPDPSPTARP